MKFQFGVNINELPDFLDGKAVTLFGYAENDKTVKVEASSAEVVITRKKTRDSYFETQISLKQPEEEKWEKYNFPTLNKK